jgi:Na+-transporting NADH:ubiquinone oxidoreductase subunit C
MSPENAGGSEDRKFNKDSTANVFIVAIALCLVCATAVAGTAALLERFQTANQELYRKQNVLDAAGLYYPGMSKEKIAELYKNLVVERVVQLPVDKDRDGKPDAGAGGDVTEKVPAGYDQVKAIDDGKTSSKLDSKTDVAKLDRREDYSYVYIIKKSPDDDTPSKYVFPIRGKGLWSILWGYVSLDADMRTIKGLSYYAQGETPGLGGEVENPKWKEKWDGVQAFDKSGNVIVKVVKGTSQADSQVDGLSGATITSNGVTNMLQYWLGKDGFGPFIERIRKQESTAEKQASQDRGDGDTNG